MRFFIDQCVPVSISEFLIKQGPQVKLLKHHLSTTAPDNQVVNKAQKIDSILISLNSDFADIVMYAPTESKGIIGLQVKNRPEAIPHIVERLNNYLKKLKQEHYAGKLLLVEPHRIRVRQ